MSDLIGWVTVAEADEILKYEFDAVAWNDPTDYILKSGSVKTAGVSNFLNGVNTKITSDFTVGSNIKIGPTVAKILQIINNTLFKIDQVLEINDLTPIYRLTDDQANAYKIKYDKKIRALWTAYNQIIDCQEYNLSGQTETTATLRKGQSLWALDIFTANTGISKRQSDLDSGIKKRKVGDLELEYMDNAGTYNPFGSLRTRKILQPYEISAYSATFQRPDDEKR